MKFTHEDLTRFVGDVDITISTTPQVKALIKQLIAEKPEYAKLPVKSVALLLLLEQISEISPGELEVE